MSGTVDWEGMTRRMRVRVYERGTCIEVRVPVTVTVGRIERVWMVAWQRSDEYPTVPMVLR